MVNYLCMPHKSYEWFGASVQHPQTRVQTSKKQEKAAFRMYQASELLARKRHAMDHLCEAVTHVGEIENLYAGLYETLQKQFKEMFAPTSQRKRSSKSEVAAVQNSKDPGPSNTSSNRNFLE